jgi:hypothetical protein
MRGASTCSIVLIASIAMGLTLAGCLLEAAELLFEGHERVLRQRSEDEPASSPHLPALLILELDGVNRDLLYGMLRQGELPQLASLFFAQGQEFPHAYFDETLIATLPSSTIPAWVSTLTGVAPAQHGVTGNEFFIREQCAFVAPAPVTLTDRTPVLKCFTDGYLNKFCMAPTVYERMRERDQNVLIWVGMQQIYRGADKLLLTHRRALADASEAFLKHEIAEKAKHKSSMAVYQDFDEEMVDTVVGELDGDGPLPDVLTMYFSGVDQFAHVYEGGPDEARKIYLREALEPLFLRLNDALTKRQALTNRYVVLTSDHGHTEVLGDAEHALGTDDKEDPPAVLARAGFHVRPFELDVPPDQGFDTVLAYQGAIAYVYVADRSSKNNRAYDWAQPPRFEEDVVPVAQAFYQNNLDGASVPSMKGTLDMVLARRPVRVDQDDLPFEVYVGDGKLVPIAEYLAQHPHPTYVALEERLSQLAVGPFGERAGDVLLIAHNGDRDQPKDRYYFSAVYRSWHGSPSRQDADIPLIVAHAHDSSSELAELTAKGLGSGPYQKNFANLLLALRFDRNESKD